MSTKVFSMLFLALSSVAVGVGLVVPLLPAYANSRTAFLPFFGHFSDLKGRKPFITTGLVAYCLVSIPFTMRENVTALVLSYSLFSGHRLGHDLPRSPALCGGPHTRGQRGLL